MTKRRPYGMLMAALAGSALCAGAQNSEILIADFEGVDYAEGKAMRWSRN